MRTLSDGFRNDLLAGRLAPLLARVRGDDTLDLQIRENYLNVYYRGGSLVRAVAERDGTYGFTFDSNYLDFPGAPESIGVPASTAIIGIEACEAWLQRVPLLKDVMDRWFSAHPRREREVQQILTRENTWDKSIAGGTDYFVCDIEYVRGGGRADVVAVHWPSVGHARKRTTGHRLTFAELKYGDDALGGDSGLCKHVRQVDDLAADPDTLAAIKEEMVGIFRQKHELGLVHSKHQLAQFSPDRPELLLVIANHDPASGRLNRELEAIAVAPPAHVEVLVGTASAFGYGLYQDHFTDVSSYLRRQAHS